MTLMARPRVIVSIGLITLIATAAFALTSRSELAGGGQRSDYPSFVMDLRLHGAEDQTARLEYESGDRWRYEIYDSAGRPVSVQEFGNGRIYFFSAQLGATRAVSSDGRRAVPDAWFIDEATRRANGFDSRSDRSMLELRQLRACREVKPACTNPQEQVEVVTHVSFDPVTRIPTGQMVEYNGTILSEIVATQLLVQPVALGAVSLPNILPESEPAKQLPTSIAH